MDRQYVLAGDLRQFKHYVKFSGGSVMTRFYVDRPDVLCGARPTDTLVRYGTWNRRPDAEECLEYAKARGMKIPDVVFDMDSLKYDGDHPLTVGPGGTFTSEIVAAMSKKAANELAQRIDAHMMQMVEKMGPELPKAGLDPKSLKKTVTVEEPKVMGVDMGKDESLVAMIHGVQNGLLDPQVLLTEWVKQGKKGNPICALKGHQLEETTTFGDSFATYVCVRCGAHHNGSVPLKELYGSALPPLSAPKPGLAEKVWTFPDTPQVWKPGEPMPKPPKDLTDALKAELQKIWPGVGDEEQPERHAAPKPREGPPLVKVTGKRKIDV